jgi:radical SAM protein with 4Fe4S-binding SPASM domain
MYEQYIKQLKTTNMNKLAEYRKQLYQKPILKDLFLEVTSRCNALCEHCGSRCGEDFKEDEISAECLKKTLKEIAEAYNPKDILLNVTGGEPLMRNDLFEILQYAVDLGFRWGMTSNGMLINEDILRKMDETNMETISISLDGMKETHESFRKVPGSFDRIIENIKKLQQVPSIKIVQVTTVVNKKNIHELDDIYKLMQDLDVISWRVLNVDPIGRAKDNSDILLDAADYRYLFNYIKEKREEGLIENVEYGCSHYLGLNLEKELRDTYFICTTGLYVASILSNGDIFVCPDVERRPELIQGNIKTDSFVDVWENKFEIFRNENRTKCSKCGACENWDYCCGDSFHTWDFDNNKPNFCIKEIYRT